MTRGFLQLNSVRTRTVRDLPDLSWVSARNRTDLSPMQEYNVQCQIGGKQLDPRRVAELIGEPVVHLRVTTLENGLGYATFHCDDGRIIFDSSTYMGFTGPLGHVGDIGSRRDEVHPYGTSTTQANVMRGIELEGGFNIEIADVRQISDPDENIHTSARKTEDNEDRRIETRYGINYYKDGEVSLDFLHYIALVRRQFAYTFYGKIEGEKSLVRQTRQEPIVSELIRLELNDLRFGMHTEVNLPPPEHNRLDTRIPDQIGFVFDTKGRLEEVASSSAGNEPNPYWSADVLRAIRKGKCEMIVHELGSRDARVLSEYVLGTDPTGKTLDVNGIIASVIDATVRGAVETLDKLAKFVK